MGSFHESREHRKASRRGRPASSAFRAVGLSDPGCERESNEDRFLIVTRGDMAGYFVFDGMGGQPAGEAAAQISSDAIERALNEFSEGNLHLFMEYAIESAQGELLSRRGNPETEGMGTTVVGVVTRGDEVVIGAVGDSRAYHIQRGSVKQVTCDHTLVQHLVDSGQISPHDALLHPQSHILTRCLGSTLDFAVDSSRYQVTPVEGGANPKEWLLLCSDGLYSLVSDEEMAAVVLNFDGDEATKKLIELARSRGGFDNITALVIPLRGHLVDAAAQAELLNSSNSLPARPDELTGGSVFKRSMTRSGNRVSVWRHAGIVAVASALALIAAGIWFAWFTMRKG